MSWLILAVVAVVLFVVFGQPVIDWALNIIRGGSFKHTETTSRVHVTPEAMELARQGRKDDAAP